jgi:4-phospho-D-threonate 3-dehydrogenase / 4-phospho-D-erythronate 3-dehydrogenase
MGDPAGIGTEIIVKALVHNQIYEICRILVIVHVIGLLAVVGKSGATDVANPSQAFCELSRRDGAIVTWHRSAWEGATPEKAIP